MLDQYYRSTLTGQELDAALRNVGNVDSAVQQAEAAAAEAQGYADSINPAGFATASQGKKADTAVQPSDILNLVYPVGSIYISYSQYNSPAALFGGSWMRIQGRFLLAADSTHAAGSAGGEAEHTLTRDEIPNISAGITMHGPPASGTHIASVDGDFQAENSIPSRYTPGGTTSGASSVGRVIINVGGDQPHNNMPPYLAVYMWRRTA